MGSARYLENPTIPPDWLPGPRGKPSPIRDVIMKHLFLTLLTVALLVAPAPARAKSAVSPRPSGEAVAQKDTGNRHFEAGQYMEAIASYTKAIKASPDYFEAYYNRGLTWHNLKLFYKAIVDFDRALELRPNDPDILYFRGLAYEKTGQFGLALADIKRAAAKNNRLAKEHLKDGELKGKAGKAAKKDKAIQSLADDGSGDGMARTTRTTLTHNAYGGKTTTTVFSKGDRLYDGPEGIFKQLNHYNDAGTLRRSDTFHHALFSAKNNRNKTITHFNAQGTYTLMEYHLTGRNLGKVELFYYGEKGSLIKSETVSLSRYQKMDLNTP